MLPSFLSIVIPSFNRPDYLRRTIQSIHTHLTCPYEIIIHDDGSDPEPLQDIYKLAADVSCLISNRSNVGINKGCNIAVEIASSPLILFLNDDCWLTAPLGLDLVEVLRKPYVGYICIGDEARQDKIPDFCRNSNTSFFLTSSILNGYTAAFRKEVWKEVGGWSTRAVSSNSDDIFLTSIIKAGYFKAQLAQPKVSLANYAERGTYYTSFREGLTINIPRIFNLDIKSMQNQEQLDCEAYSCAQRHLEAGLGNLEYWNQYLYSVFGKSCLSLFDFENLSYKATEINWEIAKKHGQEKWKSLVTTDFRG